jgi:hypothetical protein
MRTPQALGPRRLAALAGIGALMWTAFRGMWEGIESDTRDRVSEVGS